MDQKTSIDRLLAAQIGDLVVEKPGEQRFDVGRRMFYDPEIFELEMRRIFESNWVYLLHESQIPHPHDYLATRIGRQPVLLTRDGGGQLHGFINSCSHRGAKLTFARRGNRQTFMCPYHGWVYDSAGHCVDVNEHASGGYPAYFDAANHDLRRVRVETYRGFVFGSIQHDVEELMPYLRGSTKIIDMLVDQSPRGLEVLKGGLRYSAQANWKLQLENFDGYHFFPTHNSYIGLVVKRMKEQVGLKTIDASAVTEAPGGVYDFGNGHVFNWVAMSNGDDRPLASERVRLTDQFGDARARWMVDHVRNLLVFPNVLIMDQASTTIRIVHPIAVDRTEVEIYCIAPVGESAAARAVRIRQYEDFLGPAGLATPDDQAVMEQCQRGYAGRAAEWQQGYVRGSTRIVAGADAPARAVGLEPDRSSGNIMDELLCHGPYRRWREEMTADDKS